MLAGPVQPGQEEYFRELVEPHIDGRQVQYVGEVGRIAKQELARGDPAHKPRDATALASHGSPRGPVKK